MRESRRDRSSSKACSSAAVKSRGTICQLDPKSGKEEAYA
jgi:hypothetical protein